MTRCPICGQPIGDAATAHLLDGTRWGDRAGLVHPECCPPCNTRDYRHDEVKR